MRRDNQSGQETLQAILVVALVLLPMLVAILTFGSLVHVSIATQAAAAAGARAAGVAGELGGDEVARIDDELRANGVDAASCRVDGGPGTVSLDEPIRVTVVCPEHVGIPFLFERNVDLSATMVARGEVNR